MADVRMVWNEPALNHLLNNPAGPVGRHMRKVGNRILVLARKKSGVRTGELRRKMSVRQGVQVDVQYVEVGSTARHALMHHEGTKRHLIVPTNGRVLRFNVGGRVVYATKVNHPGTRGNPYLTTAMRAVVRGR